MQTAGKIVEKFFCAPGFGRNLGHLSLISSSLEIYYKNADIRKNIMNGIDGAVG